MNRILTNAPFIHANMPVGTPWDVPVLTVDEAYDIAGFLSSKERPQMSGLEKDYPKLEKKPVDCPYPPYTDSFTQEQHQYGPFQPIERAKKEQQQQATTGKEPAKTSNYAQYSSTCSSGVSGRPVFLLAGLFFVTQFLWTWKDLLLDKFMDRFHLWGVILRFLAHQ